MDLRPDKNFSKNKLKEYNGKKISAESGESDRGIPIGKLPRFIQVPQVLFENILPLKKLNHLQICLLLEIYQKTYESPNLHKIYGISPIMSYQQLSEKLKVNLGELLEAINILQEENLIEVIRAGQFFIRRFFTAEFDSLYGFDYESSL